MYSSHTTAERHGYSVQFSTFATDRLLLATSQLYGLAGGGSLFLLQQHNNNNSKGLTEVCRLEWSDGLFDVAWCPYGNNIAVTASGDGSLQIWSGLDVDLDCDDDICMKVPQKPVMCLHEHKNEVYSVDWSEKWNYHQILSGSWDGAIKLWDCNRQKSVATYMGHSDLIYSAKFSPLVANIFASVGTDGILNLWNSFDFSGKPLMTVPAAAHSSEILSLDWSQFDRNVLVTGGADGCIRGWDLRNMRHHVFELYSGEFAVRNLAFSPHKASILASANYDFTTRIWDFGVSLDAVEVHEHHTEFVCGLDWNINQTHQLADCGWDSVINVFTPKSLKM